MAQTRDQLRARVADETTASLGRITRRLEQAGTSHAAVDLVGLTRRLVLAELNEAPADAGRRAAEIDKLAETLTPGEVMREAEQLLRRAVTVPSPWYKIFGALADELHEASHLPEYNTPRPADTRRFNARQGTAWAVIDLLHGRV